MKNLVRKARDLMKEKTGENGAPAWELTEIAAEKGKRLAKIYSVDKDLVLVSLYLAHIVFSPVWKDEVQRNHERLCADLARRYLDEWGVSKTDQKIILNAIRAHHDKVACRSKVAEIMKNAECFKFVTVEGSLIFLHELGRRGISFEQSVKYVLDKMEQKRKLLTIDECKIEAEKNCKEIERVFSVKDKP